MERRTESAVELHFDALPPKTSRAFRELSKHTWLRRGGWYLAGGTALALQVGHRRSLDLDFFTTRRTFETSSVLAGLGTKQWETTSVEPGTLFGTFIGAKASFIAYPFFRPRRTTLRYGSIALLRPEDIAVMKVVALSQRGRKRDFYDLYWYANNVEPLTRVLARVPAQYPDIGRDYHHLIKSLDYFADAEKDPTPKAYFPASWRDVKNFFRREAVSFTKHVFDVP